MRISDSIEMGARYWGEELNSCTITTPQGSVQTLSVPVYGSRRVQPYREIRICYMHAWQRQHWASLYSAYGKKPYWEYYADYIRPLYEWQPEYLYELNERTEYIIRCLIDNVMPAATGRTEKPLPAGRYLDLLMEKGPETQLEAPKD